MASKRNTQYDIQAVQWDDEELKQRIRRGEVTSVPDAVLTGLGTVKTARSCFYKSEGITLDEYLERNVGRQRTRP